MEKLRYVLFFLTIFIGLMIVGASVSATSWVELDPQEVSDRAEVIVIGKYDFTSKSISSDFIFQGYEFNVTSVYKGEASKKLLVGIDGNDVGWAEEFQNDGGEFLLFLEKAEDEILLPVGGPNGMIQLFNGKVEHHNDASKSFYEEFLKEQSKKQPKELSASTRETNQSSRLNSLYLSFGVLIGIAVFVLVIVFRRKE